MNVQAEDADAYLFTYLYEYMWISEWILHLKENFRRNASPIVL